VPSIEAFWAEFKRCGVALAQISSADHPVYDTLLEQLQKIDPGLFFEFATAPGDCELIVTAEGCEELFPLVETIVEQAPDVPGWTFFALKPKFGFPETVSWEGFSIDVSQVVFEPLSRNGTDDLGLRVFIPNLISSDIEDAHSAILRAIDHGLGEKAFAEEVQFIDVCPLPANSSPDDQISLAKLDAYIAWRKENSETDQ